MALLASNASNNDKLQGLLQHILLSSQDESLKTTLSAYMSQNSGSYTSNSSNGNKKKKKKHTTLDALKDLLSPKNSEASAKFIKASDKIAI